MLSVILRGGLSTLNVIRISMGISQYVYNIEIHFKDVQQSFAGWLDMRLKPLWNDNKQTQIQNKPKVKLKT